MTGYTNNQAQLIPLWTSLQQADLMWNQTCSSFAALLWKVHGSHYWQLLFFFMCHCLLWWQCAIVDCWLLFVFPSVFVFFVLHTYMMYRFVIVLLQRLILLLFLLHCTSHFFGHAAMQAYCWFCFCFYLLLAWLLFWLFFFCCSLCLWLINASLFPLAACVAVPHRLIDVFILVFSCYSCNCFHSAACTVALHRLIVVFCCFLLFAWFFCPCSLLQPVQHSFFFYLHLHRLIVDYCLFCFSPCWVL